MGMKEQLGTIVHSRRIGSLLQLAAPKNLLQLLPFRKAPMLRLRRGQPWSPEMPSSRKDLKTSVLKVLTYQLHKAQPPCTPFNNEQRKPLRPTIQRPGHKSFENMVFTADTLISPKTLLRVSTLGYQASVKHMLHQMTLLSVNFRLPIQPSLRGNLQLGDTLVPSQNVRLKTLLVLSNLCHSLLYPSQRNRENIKLCIIFRILMFCRPQFAQSTPQSMPTTIPVHKVLLLLFVSSFRISQQVPKLLSVMWLKLIGQFLFDQISGQGLLFVFGNMTSLLLTPATTLVSHLVVGFMVELLMPEQTSSERMEWVWYPSGLMTTSFSVFPAVTYKHTMRIEPLGGKRLQKTGGVSTMVAEFGTLERQCQMENLRNLTRIVALCYKTYLGICYFQ